MSSRHCLDQDAQGALKVLRFRICSYSCSYVTNEQDFSDRHIYPNSGSPRWRVLMQSLAFTKVSNAVLNNYRDNLSKHVFGSFCQSTSWLNGWCVAFPPLAIVCRYFCSFAHTTTTATHQGICFKQPQCRPCLGHQPPNDQCCGGSQ